MLLRVKTDNERGNVDNLLANTGGRSVDRPLIYTGDSPNVPLPDQNTSMVNTLGQSTLEYLSLEPPLQEILNLQS